MSRNLLALLVFCVATSAFAGTQIYTEWRGLDGGDWFLASNWSNGVPVQLDPLGGPQGTQFGKAGFKGWAGVAGGAAPKVASPGLTSGITVNVDQIVMGGQGAAAFGGYMTLSGATVNVSEFLNIGNNNGSTPGPETGILNVYSGTLNCGTKISGSGHLFVGYKGVGTINMNGGVLNLTSFLSLADQYAVASTARGTVNLFGGTIYATDLKMNGNADVSHINITDGTMVLNGNKLSTLAPWLNTWITTTKANATVTATYDAQTNKTTLFATPEPASMVLLGLGAVALIRRK